MAIAEPTAVTFELDAAECDRITARFLTPQTKTGTAILLATIALWAVDGFSSLATSAARGDGIVCLILAAFVSAIVVARRLRAGRVRPQITTIALDASGLRLCTGPSAARRTTRIVPYARIRSVRSTPDALLVFGKRRFVAAIPMRVLPDGGAAFMRAFDERLVGKRLLRRGDSLGTLVVNSASP